MNAIHKVRSLVTEGLTTPLQAILNILGPSAVPSTGYTPPLPDFGQFDGLHMHRLTHRDLTVQLGLSDWAHVLTCVADEWHDAGYTDGHRLLVFEEFARNEWLEGYREVALFLGQSAVLGEEAYA